MFKAFVTFVLAFWLFRQPGVAENLSPVILGVTAIMAALLAGFLAMALTVYLTIIWPGEIKDYVRFRLGSDLTAAERLEWLNGGGCFAKAKTLDEARRWKQIELREPWNLPLGLGRHWIDRTGSYRDI
jgi:hypothetical protein